MSNSGPRATGGASTHADPLRPVHADRVRRASSQIERHPAGKRTTIVDHNGDGPAVFGICHRHLRSKRQRAVGRSVPTAIEGLTGRGASPGNIVGGNHVLPGTGSMGPGVREEPGEASAVCLRRRRNQERRRQSGDAKQGTQGSPPQSATTRVCSKREDAQYNGRDDDQRDEASKHSLRLKKPRNLYNRKPALSLPLVPDLTFGFDINLNANIALRVPAPCLRLIAGLWPASAA
jgi:hypothetical protein